MIAFFLVYPILAILANNSTINETENIIISSDENVQIICASLYSNPRMYLSIKNTQNNAILASNDENSPVFSSTNFQEVLDNQTNLYLTAIAFDLKLNDESKDLKTIECIAESRIEEIDMKISIKRNVSKGETTTGSNTTTKTTNSSNIMKSYFLNLILLFYLSGLTLKQFN